MPAEPNALFQGFNSITGEGLNTAVTGDFVKSTGVGYCRCDISVGYEETSKKFGFSNSCSAGFGEKFGIGQKKRFLNEMKLTHYSVVVTVSNSSPTSIETISNARFKDGVSVPTSDAAVDEFTRKYGDAYICELVKGTEYFASWVFYAETESQQREIEKELNAKGVIEGVELSGELQANLSKATQSMNVSSKLYQMMSGVSGVAYPSADKICEFALKFSAIPSTSLGLIRTSFYGYERAVGAGTQFDKIVKNRLYFLGTTATPGMSTTYAKLTEVYNQIDQLKGIYQFYHFNDDPTLISNEAKVQKDLAAIEDQILGFLKSPTTPLAPYTADSLSLGLPCLNVRIRHYPDDKDSQWGGTGGNYFSTVDDAYVQRKTRIQSISMRAGSTIDQLVVINQSYNGSASYKLGGNGGDDKGVLSLDGTNSKFVKKVFVRSGSWLDYLSITAEDGRSISGGKSDGGTAHEWSTPSGSFTMGFRGGHGSRIDRIQVVYGTLQPAIWKK